MSMPETARKALKFAHEIERIATEQAQKVPPSQRETLIFAACKTAAETLEAVHHNYVLMSSQQFTAWLAEEIVAIRAIPE
jgi:hypothetical protein